MCQSLARGNILKISLVISALVSILMYYHTVSSSGKTQYTKDIMVPTVTHDYFYVVSNGTNDTSRNVIAILTTGENYTALGQRLGEIGRLLDDNLTAHIIIFHNGYPDDFQMSEMHRYTTRRVILYNVDKYFIRFPVGLNPYSTRPNWHKRTKWNYHHMIYFWFKIVFELPLIQSYDYMMRLDDDSRLLGKWINAFDLMQKRGAVYMANFETLDYEWILPGTLKLKDLTLDYVNRAKTTVQNPKQFERAFSKDSARTYWNNFEITRIQFFRQKNVTHWVEAVTASQGIYKYRWGDAILRYLTLAIFAKEDQVLHRVQLNLGYCHPC